MAKKLVLALDLGTTSAKAVIFETNGKLVCEAERMITSYYPEQGWAEQDAAEIEVAARGAVRDALKKGNVRGEDLLTVGFSAAMHSFLCVDEQMNPLSNATIWADGRSREQARKLRETVGSEIYANTGLPNHPMSPFSKLLWMKDTAFEPYKKAAYFMSAKEYVIQKWFGVRQIDYAMASATGMFNMNTFAWDEQALQLAGIRAEQLSDVVPPTTILQGLDEQIAAEMGLSASLPFVIGSADGQLANLGSGAIEPGEVAISAGTSGAIRQMTKGFHVSDAQEVFCYAFTDELSIIGGPTNNGGIALQWLKELIEYEGSFEELTAEAEKVEIGAEGLLFHPYINGERAPIWLQEAKGNFFGLCITHKKEHLVRAVLEGITYNIYHINMALEQEAGETKKIYVNGGLARSPLWVQMLADVFGKSVYLSESHHSAAWGAAWTALYAIGEVESLEAIKQNIPIEAVIKPNMESHAKYKAQFTRYRQLALDLMKHFT